MISEFWDVGSIDGMRSTLQWIEFLSMQRHEHAPIVGAIMLTQNSANSLTGEIDERIIVPLRKTLRCRDARAVVKALRGTPPGYSLFISGDLVHGYARTTVQSPDALIVNFFGSGRWNLQIGSKILLRTDESGFHYPCDDLRLEELEVILMNKLETPNTKVIRSYVEALISAEQGGVIIVLDDPGRQLDALAVFQRTTPRIHSRDVISALAHVDGAIFCDHNGNIHAFGVLFGGLGVIDSNYDSSRGSRYNSSKWYVASLRRKGIAVVAIVRSDDGMLDIFPDPTHE